MHRSGLKQPLSDAELEEVHAVLDAGTEGLESGELDGFLTAISTAPCDLDPDDWLGTVLGDFEFKSDADSLRFVQLLLRRHNEVARQLASEDSPWPSASMGEDEAADWCSGYMRGFREDPTWAEDEGAAAHLTSIAVLAGETSLVGDATPILAKYRALLPETVRTLDGYWEEQRAIEANLFQPATSSKQNRNDPCACGSGRKHKKCCGQ